MDKYTEADIITTAQGVGWRQISIKDELRIWGTIYEHKTANLMLILTPDGGGELALHVVTKLPISKFLQVANELFPKPIVTTVEEVAAISVSYADVRLIVLNCMGMCSFTDAQAAWLNEHIDLEACAQGIHNQFDYAADYLWSDGIEEGLNGTQGEDILQQFADAFNLDYTPINRNEED